LSPAQTADAIARRKAIYLELYPKTRAGVAGGVAGGRGREKIATDKLAVAFTKATAAATGKSERDVRRDAARGKALGGSLAEIAGTSLDSGVELDALAKKPEAERASW
jgi:hypothetical protein